MYGGGQGGKLGNRQKRPQGNDVMHSLFKIDDEMNQILGADCNNYQSVPMPSMQNKKQRSKTAQLPTEQVNLCIKNQISTALIADEIISELLLQPDHSQPDRITPKTNDFIR